MAGVVVTIGRLVAVVGGDVVVAGGTADVVGASGVVDVGDGDGCPVGVEAGELQPAMMKEHANRMIKGINTFFIFSSLY